MNDAYYNQDAATRCAIEDNEIDEREREYRKRNELLSKFTDGWTKYNKEPLFRNIIEATLRGADPWDMINKLVDMNAQLSERCKKLLTYGSFPHDFNFNNI